MGSEQFRQLDACFAPFDSGLKREVRAEQHNKCAVTGKRCNLEVHHCVPESLLGANRKINAVAFSHRIHIIADKLAFQGCTWYGDITDLPEAFFRNGGNPFKDFDYSKSQDIPRDLLRVAKRSKRRKRKHKKIETMPCPRQGWYT